MFIMDAEKTKFTNCKQNPVRPWFARMIKQLMMIISEEYIDWNLVNVKIEIHPELWFCICRLYSYAHYFDAGGLGEFRERNVYFTTYDAYAQFRHEEYLFRHALPVLGQWYSVDLNDRLDPHEAYFNVSIPDISVSYCEKFSGLIKNIHCCIDCEGE